jgi:hypothetical protein
VQNQYFLFWRIQITNRTFDLEMGNRKPKGKGQKAPPDQNEGILKNR